MSVYSHSLGRNEFAALCGVTPQSITDWMADGMPGVTKPSKREVAIDIFVALPWVREQRWKPKGDDKARKQKADADIAEMEAAKMRGELIPASAVESEWVKVAHVVRTKILGLPVALRQRVPHLSADDQAVLEALAREICQELADQADAA